MSTYRNRSWTAVAALGCLAAAMSASCGSSGDDSASNSAFGSGGGGGGGTDKDAGTYFESGANESGTLQPDGGTGGCVGDCTATEFGVGTSHPFSPSQTNSGHVGVDAEGALVLDRSATGTPNLIWISNTGESTVSKVDTNTYQELGRYRSGSGDPSRTSVNSLGDVFVGNRGGASLTRISAAAQGCPDTNGDGVITTSAGAGNTLAPGQDDCVIWETPLGGDIRGVAAQDIIKQVTTDPDLPPQIEIHRYVWAGGLHGKIYKLDAETGALLLTTDAPTPVYGFALDGNGQLWMSSGGTSFGRLDTTVCVDDASCNVTLCDTSCDASGSCSDACDTAVKQRIAIPDSMYGITVDFKQRVWLGGGQGLKRYNPHAAVAERFAMTQNGFSHGVAADALGFIWGAAAPNVVRLNGDTLEQTIVALPSSKGMAVDTDGKIWIIGQASSAHVIVPGQGINDNTVMADAVGSLVTPYTYSDMTGLQAALASNDPGYYRQVFEGCAGDQKTTWTELTWDADVPTDTSVTFRVRTAATEAGLAGAKWVVAAGVPGSTSPADLITRLEQANVDQERYLEVEVWLALLKTDPTGKLTPKVKTFGATFSCPPSLQ